MKHLPALVALPLFLGLTWPASARADLVLDGNNSYIESYNNGIVYDTSKSGYVYNYVNVPTVNQGSNPTVSSSDSYTSPPSTDFSLSATTSGSASVLPSPANFNHVSFTASTTMTSTNNNPNLGLAQQSLELYNGYFTANKTYDYTLKVSNNTSSSSGAFAQFSVDFSGGGSGYLVSVSNSGITSQTFTGKLGPGYYNIQAYTNVLNENGQFNPYVGTVSGSASGSFDLTLKSSVTSAPEPPGLVLLALGVVGMGGCCVWRRRKAAAAVC